MGPLARYELVAPAVIISQVTPRPLETLSSTKRKEVSLKEAKRGLWAPLYISIMRPWGPQRPCLGLCPSFYTVLFPSSRFHVHYALIRSLQRICPNPKPNPRKMEDHPVRLSVTVYSFSSQLPSISRKSTLHLIR